MLPLILAIATLLLASNGETPDSRHSITIHHHRNQRERRILPENRLHNNKRGLRYILINATYFSKKNYEITRTKQRETPFEKNSAKGLKENAHLHREDKEGRGANHWPLVTPLPTLFSNSFEKTRSP